MRLMKDEQKALFGLSLGHFVLDMYAAILIPLYPYIAQRLNINILTISAVIAIGHAISSVMQPVFGFISDKIQKRFFMFWGIMLACVFVPFGFSAPNVFILTTCLILGMLGNAFYHPQVTTIIKDFYEEKRNLSFAIGVFLGLGTIGYAIAPYFSTYFLETFGDEKYGYITLIGLICAIFILLFVPKVQHKNNASSGHFLEAMKEILQNKTCLFLILITVIKAALVMSFGTYMPFLFKKYGFSMTQTGLIVTLFYVAGGLSMIVSSHIEKIIKLRGIIVASFLPLLPLSCSAIYFLEKNKILACLFFIIAGFFVLLSAGVVLAQAQRIMPKCSGTISGIIQGFTLALGSLLLIPLGFLAQSVNVQSVLILVTLTAFILALYSTKTKLI